MGNSQSTRVVLGVLGAGLIAAAGGFLLFREASAEEEQRDMKSQAKKSLSREDVIQLLRDVVDSQESLKEKMTAISKELLRNSVEVLSFDDVYAKVQEAKPVDAMEKWGVSMDEFDSLLDSHQNDPEVRDMMMRIMAVGGPEPPADVQQKAANMSPEKIVEVHKFMEKELADEVSKFEGMDKGYKQKFETRGVVIAVQTMVGVRTEAKFGVGADVIETAVMLNHASLANSEEFQKINQNLQMTMSRLVEA